MTEKELPMLFCEADKASNRKQAHFLIAIRLEIFSLIIAAVLGAAPIFAGELRWTAIMFLSLAAISLVYRVFLRPERDWYQARALAESVKTLSWRYSVRAEPFAAPDKSATERFTTELRDLLAANKSLGHLFDNTGSSGRQVTDRMKIIRTFSLQDRRSLYLQDRAVDQLRWYQRKSKLNRNGSIFWMAIALILYAITIFIIAGNGKISFLSPWPIEPLLLSGMAVVGWMQIKKFSELSAAYSLAAQEIGLAIEEAESAEDEPQFSVAVNSTERAFSREHVQWIARQEEA